MNTKEINPKDYLTTLQRDTDDKEKFVVPIQFRNYFDLGCMIESINSVCRGYLLENAENNQINIFDVVALLELQQQLIPLSEMEYLDKIQEKI